MYTRYAERRGWKTELMEVNETGLGGIKEAVMPVSYTHLDFSIDFISDTDRNLFQVPQRIQNRQGDFRGALDTAAVSLSLIHI